MWCLRTLCNINNHNKINCRTITCGKILTKIESAVNVVYSVHSPKKWSNQGTWVKKSVWVDYGYERGFDYSSSIISYSISSIKEVNIFTCVCLFFCFFICQQNYIKITKPISTKLAVGMGPKPGKKPFNFGWMRI